MKDLLLRLLFDDMPGCRSVVGFVFTILKLVALGELNIIFKVQLGVLINRQDASHFCIARVLKSSRGC